MPQASSELQALFEDDSDAWYELEGFWETRGGRIHCREGRVLTDMEKKAIRYLCDEWDYVFGEEASMDTQLPERDLTKPTEQQGLFAKFTVLRNDMKDEPGKKHADCDYFVLDVSHDPYAKAALSAYAAACRETHPDLSADMVKRYSLSPLQNEKD